MTEETTIEALQEKVKIYQKLFESLAPSVPLNALTPSSQNTLTPSTQGSLTPSLPLVQVETSSKTIFKPNKRYIKVEEILKLTNLKKNEYSNLLVSRGK
jgi:hypothetical protein